MGVALQTSDREISIAERPGAARAVERMAVRPESLALRHGIETHAPQSGTDRDLVPVSELVNGPGAVSVHGHRPPCEQKKPLLVNHPQPRLVIQYALFTWAEGLRLPAGFLCMPGPEQHSVNLSARFGSG